MLSACLTLFANLIKDLNIREVALISKVAAALTPVEFLELLLFTWNWFDVGLGFIDLEFYFFIFGLIYEYNTPNSLTCFWRLSITTSAVLSFSYWSYFWSHRRCTVAIIVTKLDHIYAKSGKNYRWFSVSFPIIRLPTYKGLNSHKRIPMMLVFSTSTISLRMPSSFFLFSSDIPWIMLFSSSICSGVNRGTVDSIVKYKFAADIFRQ